MLELASVQVNYGAAVALRDVSLRVGAGELVCVVGPNGAGKIHADQCDRGPASRSRQER